MVLPLSKDLYHGDFGPVKSNRIGVLTRAAMSLGAAATSGRATISVISSDGGAPATNPSAERTICSGIAFGGAGIARAGSINRCAARAPPDFGRTTAGSQAQRFSGICGGPFAAGREQGIAPVTKQEMDALWGMDGVDGD